jgi:hypothetical protein
MIIAVGIRARTALKYNKSTKNTRNLAKIPAVHDAREPNVKHCGGGFHTGSQNLRKLLMFKEAKINPHADMKWILMYQEEQRAL